MGKPTVVAPGENIAPQDAAPPVPQTGASEPATTPGATRGSDNGASAWAYDAAPASALGTDASRATAPDVPADAGEARETSGAADSTEHAVTEACETEPKFASTEAEDQPDDKAEQRMSMEDAIRFIQVNERGRQGKQRARFMKEIRKEEEEERLDREGQHELLAQRMQNEHGETAMLVAINSKKHKVALALLQKMPEAALRACDSKGESLLHAAVRFGLTEVALAVAERAGAEIGRAHV